MAKFIRINIADNVAVAVSDAAKGESCLVDGAALVAVDDIPAGHKIALKDFTAGENVIKYGYPVGHVTWTMYIALRHRLFRMLR